MKYLKVLVITSVFTTAVMLLSATTTYAVDSSVAIGLKMGEHGVGIEGRIPVAKNFFARAGFNYIQYNNHTQYMTISDDSQISIESNNHTQYMTISDDSQISIESKLTLLSFPIMLDWHPLDNSGFKVSVGVAYNSYKAKSKLSFNKAVSIDGISYTADDIGLITTSLKFGNAIAGIVSIGYDSSFLYNKPWSINTEVGVMYSSNPKLSVISNGSGNAAVKAAVEKAAQSSLKNRLKKHLRISPVLSVGFKYAF